MGDQYVFDTSSMSPLVFLSTSLDASVILELADGAKYKKFQAVMNRVCICRRKTLYMLLKICPKK